MINIIVTNSLLPCLSANLQIELNKELKTLKITIKSSVSVKMVFKLTPLYFLSVNHCYLVAVQDDKNGMRHKIGVVPVPCHLCSFDFKPGFYIQYKN